MLNMKYLFSRYASILALFFLFFTLNAQAQPSTGSLFIIGSATAGGWDNPIADTAKQKFTQISTMEYKITVDLIGGGEYKFIAKNGSWTENWGIKTAKDPTEVNGGPFTSNSQNIMAPAASGTYIININFAANIFTVKLANVAKVNITSFSPTTAATGSTVTIKGVGFTGATLVSFGGTNAASFNVIDDSTVTAIVGKGASGAIQVISPNGTGGLSGFTYNTNTLFIVGSATHGGWTNPIPAVDSALQQFTQISPTEYKITLTLIGGGSYKLITLNGSWATNYGIGIANDPNMTSGGTLVSNGNDILAPAASGTYVIDVNFASNKFIVTPFGNAAVSISSFLPTSAATGDTVLIKGIGFTGATSVSFGATMAASYTVGNDSTITAVLGGGATGTVQVVSPNGTAALAGFTFKAVTKSDLYILGSATHGGWNNPIPGADSIAQKFTQINAYEYKIHLYLVSGGEYKFVPMNGSWTNSFGIAKQGDTSMIYSGSLVSNGQNIAAPPVTGTYTINVNLSTNTYTVTLDNAASIAISSFAPTSAVAGTTVTIKGIGFTGATGVGFGGTAAASYLVINDSTVTAVVSTGATGAVIVVGTNGTASLDGFTFVSAPANTLFILGSATTGGWNNPLSAADSVAQQFTAVSGTEFKISVHLTGGAEYKFIPTNGSWNNSYGIALNADPSMIYGGTLVTNGNNILAPSLTGTYTINVNTATNKFTVSLLSPDTLFILGNATANGWNNPLQAADSLSQQFTKIGASEFNITVFLAGDSSYKLIARNGDWTYNWGITVNNDSSMVYSGNLLYGAQSKNILAPHESGIYTIHVNFTTGLFDVISVTPVTIASFSASATSKSILANWHTSTELNTSSFAVQHSIDGIHFATVGVVKATGSGANNYQFTDNNPTNGTNYYRLQSIDKNGSSGYSKVVSVSFTAKTNKYLVYPTIIRSGIVNIRTSDAVAGKAVVRLVDLNGKTLQTTNITIASGSNVVPFKVNAVAKGSYILQVENATDKQAHKVIVE